MKSNRRKILHGKDFITLLVEVTRIVNARSLKHFLEELLQIVRSLDLILTKALKCAPIATDEDSDTDEEYIHNFAES